MRSGRLPQMNSTCGRGGIVGAARRLKLFRGRGIGKREIYRNRRVIRNAIGYGIIEIAHGEWEMGSELVAHSFAARPWDEGFHKKPVQLVAPYQPSKLALK